jgi:hypothetical protein
MIKVKFNLSMFHPVLLKYLHLEKIAHVLWLSWYMNRLIKPDEAKTESLNVV